MRAITSTCILITTLLVPHSPKTLSSLTQPHSSLIKTEPHSSKPACLRKPSSHSTAVHGTSSLLHMPLYTLSSPLVPPPLRPSESAQSCPPSAITRQGHFYLVTLHTLSHCDHSSHCIYVTVQ